MGVIMNNVAKKAKHMPLLILTLVALTMLEGACHPFSMFQPPVIKPTKLSVLSPDKASVEIAVDGHGIPFIKGGSIDDVVYGLGFMHARDRLFQLDLLRHAAQGRTSELFGERGLFYDKKLRLLTFRLDDQLQAISPEENHLIDNYVRGVNDGAKKRGRSAEHFLLGIQFEEFSKRDVIGIARLQTWQLASDLLAEITRLKIARSNLSVATKNELFAPIDDRGSSIITNHQPTAAIKNFGWPAYLSQAPQTNKSAIADDPGFIQTSGGASNAWVVEGRMSPDGHAVLMNDPHLIHTWPSNFYLATLSAGDFFVTGATFVGLPGVLIGASKYLSWGVTASYLNTQDSVLLELDKEHKNTYIVDGKNVALEQWPQRYCMPKKGKCFEEMNYVSMYGPVINHSFEPWIDKNDALAVQWTGFRVEEHKFISHGFIELAQAKNVNEAIKAIKPMTLPGVNLVLADTSGNIAYAYAGLVPARDSSQHHYLPLDGRFSSSRWSGFLNRNLEPQTINPGAGFIVTANQNIFAHDSGANFNYGQQGAPPYRALRIKERIENSLKTNTTLDFNDLSTIQLDDMSLEARELAPLVGAICEVRFATKDNTRKAFAQAVKSFDGHYTTDSLGALPYDLLTKQILSKRMADALDKEIPDRVAYFGQIGYNVKDALHKELTGTPTAIFEDIRTAAGGMHQFVGQACEDAFKDIVKKAGASTWKWRWGRHHYLQRQSLLAKVPFIGGFFRDKKREVAGVSNAPLAESGTPVIYGANLRFRAKMSSPPQIFAVIDSGNSGTVGDKNAFDQAVLWQEGKSILLETDWAKALEKSVLRFTLEP
jgi:penicillin G amidase